VRRLVPAFFLSAFLVVPALVFAASPAKDEVLARYEKAVALTEELRLPEKDSESLRAKIREAGESLMVNDLANASDLLDESMVALEVIRRDDVKKGSADFRLEWLETYLNVFRWFAVIALLGFLFERWPFYGKMLEGNRLSLRGKVLLGLIASAVSVLLAVFDLSRYGESSWMFFDVQLVLVTAVSLYGGLVTGLLSGLLVAAFRYFLKADDLVYPLLALGAGITGGFFSLWERDFRRYARRAFVAGTLTGLGHGICVYGPSADSVSAGYLVFAVAFLALLEGTGVYLFAAVISGVLREKARRRLQYDFLKTRLLLLHSQLRPHFLFNTLNTIAAVCGNGDASAGERLVLRLSDFLRHTFDRKESSVTLKQEMSFVDAYLEIESARFGGRLKVVRDLRVSEAAWGRFIPILVIQPLVENAVKHGVSKKPEGGTITIRLTEEARVLKCEIIDDGPGRDEQYFKELFAGKAAADDVGIGVRNIHERLVQLHGKGRGLSYESAPGKGTRVRFEIPFGEREENP
jgi:LytS/YehU family sensor histidine kinase